MIDASFEQHVEQAYLDAVYETHRRNAKVIADAVDMAYPFQEDGSNGLRRAIARSNAIKTLIETSRIIDAAGFDLIRNGEQ